MATTHPPQDHEFIQLIMKTLKDQMGVEYDRLKKEFLEKLDKELDEVKDVMLAGITLNLQRQIQMETRGEHLIITLNTQPFKKQ